LAVLPGLWVDAAGSDKLSVDSGYITRKENGDQPLTYQNRTAKTNRLTNDSFFAQDK